jgi:Prenyltransferase and squalene oxidase repeat
MTRACGDAGTDDRRDACRRGIRFVLAAQDGEGLWRDFETLAGEGGDWPTAVIGARLLAVGEAPDAVRAAAAALLENQHDDGGWGYHRDVPTDADSTACALGFLVAAGHGGRAVERAGRCLSLHQDRWSGGVATYRKPDPIRRYMRVGRGVDLSGWCSHHLEVTATAGWALASVPGGRFAAEAVRAWKYVERRQDVDGGWRSYWWTAREYPTLQAAELSRALAVRGPVQQAAGWALANQRADGGWGAPGAEFSAFASALALILLRRADRRGEAVRRGAARLADAQASDGGWPIHPVMRIPPPDVAEPELHSSWRADALGTGVVVGDHHRLFTSALCVSALALAGGAPG